MSHDHAHPHQDSPGQVIRDPHDLNPGFDPVDPHGVHAGDKHGHVIVSGKMLLGILGILLFFTALTVFLAQAEKWAASTFDIHFPDGVNVAIAMSIATVKALLVALFFMQLKYDNKLHSLIMCFCILAFGCFLGFTGLDLLNRDRIDPIKAGERVSGGTGGGDLKHIYRDPKTGERVVESVPANTPLYQFAKQNPEKRLSEKALAKIAASHHHDDHAANVSTANRTKPMTSPILFAEHDDHGDGHHADPAHADDPTHTDPPAGEQPPAGGH